ncbi:MAG: hypothetical protein AAGJ35_15730, partial [Myxococcota bacterium]
MHRKRLMVTHQRVEHVVQKQHKVILKRARLARLVRDKKRQRGEVLEDTNDYTTASDKFRCLLQPDHDVLLQREQEEAQLLQTSLFDERWSLDRAIRLHDPHQTPLPEDKLLTKSLKTSSYLLYEAYTFLEKLQTKLAVPTLHKSRKRLVQYATIRNHLKVPNVSKSHLKQTCVLAAGIFQIECHHCGYPFSTLDIAVATTELWQQLSKDATTTLDRISPKHIRTSLKTIHNTFPELEYEKPMRIQLDFLTRQIPPVAQQCVAWLRPFLPETTSLEEEEVAGRGLVHFVCSVGSALQRLAQEYHQSKGKKRVETLSS